MDIVEMEARHIPAVLSLWAQTEHIGLHDDADNPEAIGRFLKRNPGMSVVATDNGNVIGAVLCGTDGRRGYLHHLAVTPSFRRQGIGSTMVNKTLETLKKTGIQKCHLFLFQTNESGRQFWEKSGWKQREDLVILSKVY